jgi:hypothetical protein
MTAHEKFMNTREEKITISIGADPYQRREIEEEYLDRTGTDNPYHDMDLYREIERSHTTRIVLRDTTWQEAQAFAEPIRIAHPEQCVTLYAGNSFIGNTSWKDQMDMFWEYPVYTPYGQKLRTDRMQLAEVLGQTASWC